MVHFTIFACIDIDIQSSCVLAFMTQVSVQHLQVVMSSVYAVPLGRLIKLDTLSLFFYYELLMTVIKVQYYYCWPYMKVIKVHYYY